MDDVIYVFSAQQLTKTLFIVTDFYGPWLPQIQVRLATLFVVEDANKKRRLPKPHRPTKALTPDLNAKYKLTFRITEPPAEPKYRSGLLNNQDILGPIENATYAIRVDCNQPKFRRVTAYQRTTLYVEQWVKIVKWKPTSPYRQPHGIMAHNIADGQMVHVPRKVLEEVSIWRPFEKVQPERWNDLLQGYLLRVIYGLTISDLEEPIHIPQLSKMGLVDPDTPQEQRRAIPYTAYKVSSIATSHEHSWHAATLQYNYLSGVDLHRVQGFIMRAEPMTVVNIATTLGIIPYRHDDYFYQWARRIRESQTQSK
jgi:hypothetical protein